MNDTLKRLNRHRVCALLLILCGIIPCHALPTCPTSLSPLVDAFSSALYWRVTPPKPHEGSWGGLSAFWQCRAHDSTSVNRKREAFLDLTFDMQRWWASRESHKFWHPFGYGAMEENANRATNFASSFETALLLEDIRKRVRQREAIGMPPHDYFDVIKKVARLTAGEMRIWPKGPNTPGLAEDVEEVVQYDVRANLFPDSPPLQQVFLGWLKETRHAHAAMMRQAQNRYPWLLVSAEAFQRALQEDTAVQQDAIVRELLLDEAIDLPPNFFSSVHSTPRRGLRSFFGAYLTAVPPTTALELSSRLVQFTAALWREAEKEAAADSRKAPPRLSFLRVASLVGPPVRLPTRKEVDLRLASYTASMATAAVDQVSGKPICSSNNNTPNGVCPAQPEAWEVLGGLSPADALVSPLLFNLSSSTTSLQWQRWQRGVWLHYHALFDDASADASASSFPPVGTTAIVFQYAAHPSPHYHADGDPPPATLCEGCRLVAEALDYLPGVLSGACSRQYAAVRRCTSLLLLLRSSVRRDVSGVVPQLHIVNASPPPSSLARPLAATRPVGLEEDAVVRREGGGSRWLEDRQAHAVSESTPSLASPPLPVMLGGDRFYRSSEPRVLVHSIDMLTAVVEDAGVREVLLAFLDDLSYTGAMLIRSLSNAQMELNKVRQKLVALQKRQGREAVLLGARGSAAGSSPAVSPPFRVLTIRHFLSEVVNSYEKRHGRVAASSNQDKAEDSMLEGRRLHPFTLYMLLLLTAFYFFGSVEC